MRYIHDWQLREYDNKEKYAALCNKRTGFIIFDIHEISNLLKFANIIDWNTEDCHIINIYKKTKNLNWENVWYIGSGKFLTEYINENKI